jgi:hypothetical protein
MNYSTESKAISPRSCEVGNFNTRISFSYIFTPFKQVLTRGSSFSTFRRTFRTNLKNIILKIKMVIYKLSLKIDKIKFTLTI